MLWLAFWRAPLDRGEWTWENWVLDREFGHVTVYFYDTLGPQSDWGWVCCDCVRMG